MDLLEFLSQRIREETNVQKKAQYRRDLIKAIISSYPPKASIHMREFSHALGFRPQASSIYMMVNKMIAGGEIKSYGVGKSNARGYVVLKPGNTYQQERGVEPTPEQLVKEGYVSPKQVYAQRERRAREAGLDEVVPEESSEPDTQGFYTFAQLEALAMRQQFYNPNGTVADFIKTLKEI